MQRFKAEARLAFAHRWQGIDFTGFQAVRVQRMSSRAGDRKGLDCRSPLCLAYAARVDLPNLTICPLGDIRAK